MCRNRNTVLWSGAVAVLLLSVVAGHPSGDQSHQSTFDSIFSAISDKANKLVSKARDTLSLSSPVQVSADSQHTQERELLARKDKSLLEEFYNKMSHLLPPKDPTKRSVIHKMNPALVAQLQAMLKDPRNSFKEPEMERITKVSVPPFKRYAQSSGYSYPPPQNPLQYPSEKLKKQLPRTQRKQSDQLDGFNIINLIENIENPTTKRIPGKLVTQFPRKLTGFTDIFQTKINNKQTNNIDKLEDETKEPLIIDNDDNSVITETTQNSFTATPISFTDILEDLEERKDFLAPTLTISSTPSTFRIIQPIQIVSTTSPSRFQKKKQKTQKEKFRSKKQKFQSFPVKQPKSSDKFIFSSPSPTPLSSSSSSSSPSSIPFTQRPRAPKRQSPALTFVDNGLLSVLGDQVSGQVSGTGRQVPGFPDGLPPFTPRGVRLTLENMIGVDGQMLMNPIPGEAGTDYPVFTEVPYTSFQCNQQEFLPGIYTDTEAGCQSFHMCEQNGADTAFLCPNGTVFNQQYFVCDWWYNIDCAAQPDFFGLNQLLYEPTGEGPACQSLFCIDD